LLLDGRRLDGSGRSRFSSIVLDDLLLSLKLDNSSVTKAPVLLRLLDLRGWLLDKACQDNGSNWSLDLLRLDKDSNWCLDWSWLDKDTDGLDWCWSRLDRWWWRFNNGSNWSLYWCLNWFLLDLLDFLFLLVLLLLIVGLFLLLVVCLAIVWLLWLFLAVVVIEWLVK
jgi:hypothetical protein